MIRTSVGRLLRKKVLVQIDEAAITAIHDASEQAAPRETGGLLLGWWEEKCIRIEVAAEVVDGEATGHSWIRRQTEAQRVLDAERRKSESQHLGYVGDWHCHPAPLGASGRDLQSLSEASLQYNEPLVLIVRRADMQLDVHVAQRGVRLKVKLAG